MIFFTLDLLLWWITLMCFLIFGFFTFLGKKPTWYFNMLLKSVCTYANIMGIDGKLCWDGNEQMYALIINNLGHFTEVRGVIISLITKHFKCPS